MIVPSLPSVGREKVLSALLWHTSQLGFIRSSPFIRIAFFARTSPFKKMLLSKLILRFTRSLSVASAIPSCWSGRSPQRSLIYVGSSLLSGRGRLVLALRGLCGFVSADSRSLLGVAIPSLRFEIATPQSSQPGFLRQPSSCSPLFPAIIIFSFSSSFSFFSLIPGIYSLLLSRHRSS